MQKTQEMKITFTATIVPKKEVKESLASVEAQSKLGVFAMQELEVGGEEFVTVFGRTNVEM